MVAILPVGIGKKQDCTERLMISNKEHICDIIEDMSWMEWY